VRSDLDRYLPNLAVIERVTQETEDTKTFRATFPEESLRETFTWEPGQFQEISVFGVGEATFCLASAPTAGRHVEFSVKRFGTVTTALHDLDEGAVVGVRGPFGNWFPYERMKGKNLLFVGGGIGMAPLRSLLNFCLDNRSDYGHIDIFYGARSPRDFCFTYEWDRWRNAPDTKLYLAADVGDDTWKEYVGVVPKYLMEVHPSAENAIAITCGPPIMIKFTLPELQKLGFGDDDIITTLEMRMKCGLGKCGRCNIGHTYVCLDGPVFSYAQMKQLPAEY
jgi:NAD(P)H-flavin reductase